MTTQISGTTGVSKVQDAVVTQADLGPNVVGNGPAFRVHGSGYQTVTSNAQTLVALPATEDFDTASALSGFTFTAPVAGYYFLTGLVFGSGSTGTNLVEATITANGVYLEGSLAFDNTTYVAAKSNCSSLFYMSAGSTAVLSGRVVGTGTCTLTSADFSGFLVRAA